MISKEDENRIKNILPDFDFEILKEIIYFDSWTSFEEYHGLLIFKAFDDSYQTLEYGHNVYVGDYLNGIDEISKEEAELEIECHQKDIEEYSTFGY